MFDIEKEFEMLTKSVEKKQTDNQESKNSYPYGVCEMTWGLGSYVGKVIPDSTGKPFRKIDDIYFGSVPTMKDDGSGTYNKKYSVCGVKSYVCELSESQKNLINDVIAQIELNLSIPEEKQSRPLFKKVRRASIFYMMIRRYINADKDITEYTEPNVTVMIHRSFNFLNSVTNSVSTRNQIQGDSSWMNDFYNRNSGSCNSMTSITTSRPAVGYETVIDYNVLPKFSFEVTEENIERCNDLNSEIVNINTFDEDYYKELLEKLTQYNKELMGLNYQSHVPPTENKNQD